MIQIKVDNLEGICKNYSIEIFDRFNKSISCFIKVIEALMKNTDSTIEDFKGFETSSLGSALKRILPKIKFEQYLTNEKFITHVNNNRVPSDMRSKCRKSIYLEELKKNLIDLTYKVDERELLSADISELKCLNSYFESNYTKKISIEILSFLFDYQKYEKEINVNLAKKIDLKVCPYCNRNFITYLPKVDEIDSTKKIIRPTYDHFFYKEKYTFLTLSFYNLIPSCYVCNSNLKLKIDFDDKIHINPYIEGFDDDVTFDFDLSSDLTTGKINFIPNLKPKVGIDPNKNIRIFGNGTKDDSGNVRVFKLQEIYTTHYDTVEDVHMNFDKNNRFYSDSIKDELKKVGSNEAEFYRFHFKNYFDEKDFNKRPLAKLTKDIYLKMKEINDTI